MKILKPEQDTLAVSILNKCFRENANFRFMFGTNPARWRVRLFLKTCIRHARHQQGAYLSTDEQGVAFIWCNQTAKRRSPLSVLQALFIFPLRKFFRISKFQNTVKNFLPKEPHLYYQFLAVSKNENHLTTIVDLRDHTFGLAESMQLPIYAQTSNERTKNLYERYGFKSYGEVTFPKMGGKLYFLKRDCHLTA